MKVKNPKGPAVKREAEGALIEFGLLTMSRKVRVRGLFRYSTFRRRKKVVPLEHVCLVSDRAFRGLFVLPLSVRDSPTCWGFEGTDGGRRQSRWLP
jgi:hypothetical protein